MFLLLGCHDIVTYITRVCIREMRGLSISRRIAHALLILFVMDLRRTSMHFQAIFHFLEYSNDV